MQTARVLIETTDLPFSDIAFAAGFASIRQFNDTVRSACDSTPTTLRQKASQRQWHDPSPAPRCWRCDCRCAPRSPTRGVRPPGRQRRAGARKSAMVPTGVPCGCRRVRHRQPDPRPDHVSATLVLEHVRDLATAIARCRRLLDLDADPEAVIDALSSDADLRAVVTKAPGQRIPRTVDEHELAVRAVLGQQVSTGAARTHTARLVHAYGSAVNDSAGGLTHAFPTVTQLAAIDPAHLAVPEARRRSLAALIGALADGDLTLDAGCDWEQARARVCSRFPGSDRGPRRSSRCAASGDPDAFPASDLGVRLAAEQLGLPADPRALIDRSARWRPWRSYAVQHLWTTLDHSVNHWPPKEKTP